MSSDAAEVDAVSLLAPMWETPARLNSFLKHSTVEVEPEYSQLLRGLKNNPIVSAAGGLKYIEVPTCSLPFELLQHSESGPGHYIIRDFYGKFLKSVFESSRQNIVIGSPGIGKSAFVLYVLMYLMRPELQDPNLSLLNEVEYVLYVTPEEPVLVLVPGKQLAFTTDRCPDLSELNTAKCLYVFEPGTTKDVRPKWAKNMKTLVLVSPYPLRIEDFRKHNNVDQFYMPIWTLEEALVANEIAGNPVRPEVVMQRFNEVGVDMFRMN